MPDESDDEKPKKKRKEDKSTFETVPLTKYKEASGVCCVTECVVISE